MTENKKRPYTLEYLIIIVVVALAVVVAMKLLRSQINFLFNQIAITTSGPPAK